MLTNPPQTIISLPVHTDFGTLRAEGALDSGRWGGGGARSLDVRSDRKKKSRLLVSLPGPDKSICRRFRSLDENKLRQGQVAWISDLEIEIIIENESDLTTESLDC